jgi:hypothetical protein
MIMYVFVYGDVRVMYVQVMEQISTVSTQDM